MPINRVEGMECWHEGCKISEILRGGNFPWELTGLYTGIHSNIRELTGTEGKLWRLFAQAVFIMSYA